ncbi:MAG: uroporphyrinogen-III synthase [Comamonadaceae bacterium]|nr:MAG: uroporphyrinogen-III synthase [Comamonadaceae bacterium]
MSATRVIVTRPVREAGRWVDDLRAAGFDAVALPLIGIEAVDDVAPLQFAWRTLDRYAAVMCVSAAAVEEFFKQKEAVTPASHARDAMNSIARPRWWATGPGTGRAMREAGVPPDRIDMPAPDATRLDSEALWERVQKQIGPGARVLIVRGGDAAGNATGRDWLANEVTAAGGERDTVVAYRRLQPAFGAAETQLAAEGAAGRAIWLFSSSESIGHLLRAMPGVPWSGARAVVTHPRIGEAATAAGFGAVCLSQPRRDALVASIESLA